MNVFDCAIKIQQETKEYYEELKAECRKPEMRNLLSLLAASEVEHRERLLNLKSAHAREKAELEELDGQSCSFNPLLTGRELLETAENDPDLYQFTVRKEEQKIQLYDELATMTGDEATNAALAIIAEEERRHLDEVENIYAFAEEPQTYLEWGEFSNRREL